MTRPVLGFRAVSKRFCIYQVQKTLFRLGKAWAGGAAITRELWALRDISFEIAAGEKVALIGRNGAGKTTLLRLACGIFRPTEGDIFRSEPITPLFRYGVGLNPHLSVLDNIYIIGAFYGLLRAHIRARLGDILAFSELADFLYVPVKKLSSGQVLRLSFATFMQSADPFLAFDEGTVLGDLAFQQKVAGYLDGLMRDPRRTVFIASHSAETLKRYCGRALWLEAGHLKAAGPVREVWDQYEAFCLKSGEEKVPYDFRL